VLVKYTHRVKEILLPPEVEIVLGESIESYWLTGLAGFEPQDIVVKELCDKARYFT